MRDDDDPSELTFDIPLIVDCDCGLRYMRTAVRMTAPESGDVRCDCGEVIGAWDGSYQLRFEPEEIPRPLDRLS